MSNTTTYSLPLDWDYTSSAYRTAADKYRNLGFSDSNALRYAVGEVFDNGTFQLDGGQLPEVTVTPNGIKSTAQQQYEDWQAWRKEQREKEQQLAQADMNNYIRQGTDKWGKVIGLGMAAGAAAPMVSAGIGALANPTVQTLIGETAKGALGYMAVDKASQLVTGRTFGQNIADMTEDIPGVSRIPYATREVAGSLLNPGGYVGALPGLAAKAATGLNAAERATAAALQSAKNTAKSKALAYGSAYASLHPEQAGNVLNRLEGVAPQVKKWRDAINHYTLDAYSPTSLDIGMTNGVYYPIISRGTAIGHPQLTTVSGRAHFNPELNTAVAENRYLPAMSISDVKNYIQTVNQTADNAYQYVLDFNKLADATYAHTAADYMRSAFKVPESSVQTAQKLKGALTEAKTLNVDPLNLDEFSQVASKHGVTTEELRRFRMSHAGWSDIGSLDDMISRYNHMHDPNLYKDYLYIDPITSRTVLPRPELKLVHNFDPNRDWSGRFTGSMSGGQVELATRETPRVLRKLASKNDNFSTGNTDHILAHEYDHALQSVFPHVEETSTIQKPWPMFETPYYHANPTSRAASQVTQLQHVPYQKWFSSPHEWRSELAGYSFSHGYPADITRQTPIQIADTKSFLNRRFGEYNNLMDIVLAPGYRNIGDLTYRLTSLGYKNGGKLNYLNYSN